MLLLFAAAVLVFIVLVLTGRGVRLEPKGFRVVSGVLSAAAIVGGAVAVLRGAPIAGAVIVFIGLSLAGAARLRGRKKP